MTEFPELKFSDPALDPINVSQQSLLIFSNSSGSFGGVVDPNIEGSFEPFLKDSCPYLQ